MEDDWVFNRIPGFIERSISILRYASVGRRAGAGCLLWRSAAWDAFVSVTESLRLSRAGIRGSVRVSRSIVRTVQNQAASISFRRGMLLALVCGVKTRSFLLSL